MPRGVGGKSPANVAQHLSGIDFPCQKEDLIAHAEQNGAEDEVLEMLRSMPEGEYNNMADVMKGYGEAHHGEDREDGRSSRSGSRSQHATAGSKGGQRAQGSRQHDEEEEEEDGGHTRGGSRAQHAEAGRQSHKNR